MVVMVVVERLRGAGVGRMDGKTGAGCVHGSAEKERGLCESFSSAPCPPALVQASEKSKLAVCSPCRPRTSGPAHNMSSQNGLDSGGAMYQKWGRVVPWLTMFIVVS